MEMVTSIQFSEEIYYCLPPTSSSRSQFFRVSGFSLSPLNEGQASDQAPSSAHQWTKLAGCSQRMEALALLLEGC